MKKKVTPVEKHLARGHCCGSGCKMCPYAPKHKEGCKTISGYYYKYVLKINSQYTNPQKSNDFYGGKQYGI